MKIEEPSTNQVSIESPLMKNKQMSIEIQHLASTRSKAAMEISDSDFPMNYESRLEFLQDSMVLGSTLN